MDEGIRGIECELEPEMFQELLLFIAKRQSMFLIPWGLICNHKRTYGGSKLPGFTELRDVNATSEMLKELAFENIWEFVLHEYTQAVSFQKIDTYDEFRDSACNCCLLYYDCGMLEIYLKKRFDFQIVWDKLVSLCAQNMVVKTDSNDSRTQLCV